MISARARFGRHHAVQRSTTITAKNIGDVLASSKKIRRGYNNSASQLPIDATLQKKSIS
jgi:hypothetical protein